MAHPRALVVNVPFAASNIDGAIVQRLARKTLTLETPVRIRVVPTNKILFLLSDTTESTPFCTTYLFLECAYLYACICELFMFVSCIVVKVCRLPFASARQPSQSRCLARWFSFVCMHARGLLSLRVRASSCVLLCVLFDRVPLWLRAQWGQRSVQGQRTNGTQRRCEQTCERTEHDTTLTRALLPSLTVTVPLHLLPPSSSAMSSEDSPAAASSAASASASSSASAGDRTFHVDLHDGVERVYTRLTKGRHDLKKVKTYSQGTHTSTHTSSSSSSTAHALQHDQHERATRGTTRDKRTEKR